MTIPGEQSLSLLQEIADWGNTTTIILHGGCVFEFKGDFPKGSLAEGFYNLKGKKGFEGHLNLSKVKNIRFQDKQHRGKQSYALVFNDQDDTCIFKIFVGRTSKGELIEHQVKRFKELQAEYSQPQ
ncbi:heme utilization cystosolic carrier protein HutX [Litoribacillus peritrichatus]